MTDLIAGRIQLASSSIGQFRPAIETGKTGYARWEKIVADAGVEMQ